MKNTVVVPLIVLNVGLHIFSYFKHMEYYDSLCKRIQTNREISIDIYNKLKRS